MGYGSSAQYQRTAWLVDFICVSGALPRALHGHISEADPNALSEAELARSLEDALVVGALEEGELPLSIAELEARTGLPEATIAVALQRLPDEVEEVFPPTDPPRFVRG